jgi:hypothetical protein
MLVKSTDAVIDIERWKGLRSDHVVPKGAAIVLGFDGSKVDDFTALIATEIETGFQWPLGIWNPAEWDGVIPGHLVEAAVDDAFHDYAVARMYADPPYWKDELAAWQGRYGDKLVVKWETWRGRAMGFAVRNYKGAIDAGHLSHDGNTLFTSHVGNARKRELTERDERGERLFTVQKDRHDSPHKIDALVAAVLSWEARNDVIASGVNVGPSIYETRGFARAAR